MDTERNHEEALKMVVQAKKFEPEEFIRESSYIKSKEEYLTLYGSSTKDPQSFWGNVAAELHWFRRWDEVMSGDLPDFRFFSGGVLNVSDNCIDRHLQTHRKNKAALIWEGEPGESRVLTYQMLHDQVCKFANVLKKYGVKKGDVVSVYMQNLPETFIALLACFRIGAIYNTVFAGFSPEALRERVNNSKAKVLITCDVSFRRGRMVPLKANADKALEEAPTVKHVIVYRRGTSGVAMQEGRDLDWSKEMAQAETVCEPEWMEANEPGLLIYTSGTSGKPKGIVHAGGGFLVGTYAYTKYALDLNDADIYWNTADIGWLTSHIFVLVGGLTLGGTLILYEGALDYPNPGRVYEMVEKYRVNKLFSAPTAYRMFVKNGTQWTDKYDLSSLELFASVGEPLNPEAWEWVQTNMGGGKTVFVNTWGQTETGGTPLSGFPGAVEMKPGSCGVPFFGHRLAILDEHGNECPVGIPGNLVIRTPFPSLARDVYGDRERYLRTYFFQVPGSYFTGDAAVMDEDGHYWVLGRTDDVINVSGHRISTMEMESALTSHPKVVEAAVIEQPDPIKGTVPVAFVLLEPGTTKTSVLTEELKQKVVDEIGSFARPHEVHLVDALPKTRSGKIIRRMLREIIATGEVKGDTTGLEDAETLEQLMHDLNRPTV